MTFHSLYVFFGVCVLTEKTLQDIYQWFSIINALYCTCFIVVGSLIVCLFLNMTDIIDTRDLKLELSTLQIQYIKYVNIEVILVIWVKNEWEIVQNINIFHLTVNLIKAVINFLTPSTR